MAYQYTLEALLALLHRFSPAKVDALALTKRHIEYGLLPVGLKIHCLDDRVAAKFSDLVEGLGGSKNIIEVNHYKRSGAALCLVLPPVGSASAAILLLECLEYAIGGSLFGNPQVQIQACSAGRLGNKACGLLSIGFYLGSDVLRRYTLGDFTTTFSNDEHNPRGKRLVIYDACGDFDAEFEYWDTMGVTRVVHSGLPFPKVRTDILTCRSRVDIKNVNLLATLLVHVAYQGYWSYLGERFMADMDTLLEEHMLSGLSYAPWVHTGGRGSSADDEMFMNALRELSSYAFEEAERLRTRTWRTSHGILWRTKKLLDQYRKELVQEARRFDEGGRS